MAADGEAPAAADAVRWPSLVCRIARGDADAEAELAGEFHPRALMAASVRLNGSDAAKDIAQDTIAAALEALRAGALREPAKLPGFVLGIARNLINNHCRLEARGRDVVTAVETLPDGDERMRSNDPAIDEERRTLVRAALVRLKPVDRHIVMLTLVEGMRPREIAPLVGLPVEAVRTRKTRAVKAIGDAIEKLTRNRRRHHLHASGSNR